MMINGWIVLNLDSLFVLAQTTTAEPDITSNPLFTLFSLISYLFGSFCFWKIFQRLGATNPWFAWVPLLNTWKTYEVGRQSPWWVIGLFIPLVNIVALVFLIMALVSIVKQLGKNPWLILLMLIPLVNFWVLYHFAFQ
jgi:Family of unknown function (DUF5684)